jgi:hypothetical protein
LIININKEPSRRWDVTIIRRFLTTGPHSVDTMVATILVWPLNTKKKEGKGKKYEKKRREERESPRASDDSSRVNDQNAPNATGVVTLPFRHQSTHNDPASPYLSYTISRARYQREWNRVESNGKTAFTFKRKNARQ